MDKLIYDDRKATISNDGATIMKLLEIVHPAAQVLFMRDSDSHSRPARGRTGGWAGVLVDGAGARRQAGASLRLLQVLVDIAKSQDSEVGDGTTSVVVLANELLQEAKPFIEDSVQPQVGLDDGILACMPRLDTFC